MLLLQVLEVLAKLEGERRERFERIRRVCREFEERETVRAARALERQPTSGKRRLAGDSPGHLSLSLSLSLSPAYSTDSARYTSRISERFLNDDKDLIYHLRTCFHQHFHQAVLCGFSTHAGIHVPIAASEMLQLFSFPLQEREREREKTIGAQRVSTGKLSKFSGLSLLETFGFSLFE